MPEQDGVSRPPVLTSQAATDLHTHALALVISACRFLGLEKRQNGRHFPKGEAFSRGRKQRQKGGEEHLAPADRELVGPRGATHKQPTLEESLKGARPGPLPRSSGT